MVIKGQTAGLLGQHCSVFSHMMTELTLNQCLACLGCPCLLVKVFFHLSLLWPCQKVRAPPVSLSVILPCLPDLFCPPDLPSKVLLTHPTGWK